jgi:DNA-binding NtrC family response regulator
MHRILLVDDDPTIIENLSGLLAKSGYGVEGVNSGEKALKAIENEMYDVVVTDVFMPDIGGMNLLSEIKRTRPETIVILITGYPAIDKAVEAVKNGASDYIPKPFKIDEVRVAVEKALHERQLTRKASNALDEIFRSLSNPIRRRIMKLLGRGATGFGEILEFVELDDPSKLSFHLRKLKNDGLVEQDERKKYYLSGKGREALEVLRRL